MKEQKCYIKKINVNPRNNKLYTLINPINGLPFTIGNFNSHIYLYKFSRYGMSSSKYDNDIFSNNMDLNNDNNYQKVLLFITFTDADIFNREIYHQTANNDLFHLYFNDYNATLKICLEFTFHSPITDGEIEEFVSVFFKALDDMENGIENKYIIVEDYDSKKSKNNLLFYDKQFYEGDGQESIWSGSSYVYRLNNGILMYDSDHNKHVEQILSGKRLKM